jgi:hypothetical protein
MLSIMDNLKMNNKEIMNDKLNEYVREYIILNKIISQLNQSKKALS